MRTNNFEKPDEQTMLIAMVLQDIKDGLQSQKSNKVVSIQAQEPNSYYWAQFDPLDDEQWFDGFYGDIREIPRFGIGIAHDKLKVLELLQVKGVIKSFKVKSSKEDHGLNELIEMVRGFEVEPNLVKFLKYYEKYVDAAQPYLERNQKEHKSPTYDDTSALASAKIDGTKVLIGYADSDLVIQKKVRLEGGLYNFMHYLQGHTDRIISLAEIKTLDGCSTYKDLSEQVRYLGFDKTTKPLFFEPLTKDRIRFIPQVILTDEQGNHFSERLKAIRK